uniref:Ig-like domain-containing protein n=1 Tax=Mola mola TaxID=94237 RepID=A0A3Q3VX64_MOLML
MSCQVLSLGCVRSLPLPNVLVPSLDLVDHTIDWQREDVGDVVHVYRHKRDDPDSQAERYRGRTTVDREDLRRGLLTLLISPVRLSDSGRYSCFVPALHTRCSINLIVGKLTSGWLKSAKINKNMFASLLVIWAISKLKFHSQLAAVIKNCEAFFSVIFIPYSVNTRSGCSRYGSA